MVGLSSCNELDKEVFTNAVTSEQKEQALEMNPELAQASINAISTGAYQMFAVLGESHDDFGLPAVMMMLDSNGQDFVSPNSGYNWFSPSVALTVGSNRSDETYLIWYTCYNAIKSCNSALASIPADAEDPILQFYRGQALCFRAFYYWILAQVYQHNYAGHESAPCVPIITEENEEEAATQGAARATVQEVFDFMTSTLNEAIDLIAGSGITAQEVMSTKPKRFFNLDAAYGMLARVCLTMHDYEGALEAAQNCLSHTSCQPYSLAEVSQPTFISLDDSSWLFGLPVAPSDEAVLSWIVNFPSMMGSFCYGYAQNGAWRWCNANLFNAIPDSDVRKGWWLNGEYESANLNDAYMSYLDSFGYTDDRDNGGIAVQKYTQVKFAPYGGELNTTTNACDIPYFRIEEVYYILFEAQAMTGDVTGAVSALNNFVKTYRNPSYNFVGASSQAVQDEIWMQRRMEFWGEGFVAWFDLKRLGKPIDRRGAGYPSPFIYYVEPGSDVFVLPIPQQETQTNKLLTNADNNPEWNRPTVVKD